MTVTPLDFSSHEWMKKMIKESFDKIVEQHPNKYILMYTPVSADHWEVNLYDDKESLDKAHYSVISVFGMAITYEPTMKAITNGK